MKQVSVERAAQMIGVSSATIRNWVNAGHITPASSRPLSFFDESIINLKSKIGSVSFEKLKSRANKVGATNNFLPEEYAENPSLVFHISNIVDYLKNKNLAIDPVMFLATLRVLEKNGEVMLDKSHDLFCIGSNTTWRRQSIRTCMLEWTATLKINDASLYSHINELLIPHDGDDYLGLLYQSIFRVGGKSEQGSYYTPSKLVTDSLSHISSDIKTFLDPCCGTGKYLLVAANTFKLNPKNIYGFDCDSIAVNIAKVNLLLAYRGEEFIPNIFCLDSLSELATGEIFCETNHLIGNIDAIATNPPWGAYKNLASKYTDSGRVKSGETFSMFLDKSIQLLRQGGELSFILPESILKIKTHADIRALILNETRISKISMLGRQFTGVFTPVIRLDLIKEHSADDALVLVEKNDATDSITQARFKKNAHLTFDVSTESHEEALLNKLYAIAHLTLRKNAEWALGIVTGDNKKYVLNEKKPGTEAVFRGSDVHPYHLGEPKSFIYFTPDAFQQVAQDRYFRSPEKLIYKFISKQLVFSYDDKQCLTLNSANILIPSIPNMRIKTMLAFLNSAVFQYIFEKKFATHKILRGDIEQLPFPLIDVGTQNNIEHIVDAILCNQAIPELQVALEEHIFTAFNLNEAEIAAIKQATQS